MKYPIKVICADCGKAYSPGEPDCPLCDCINPYFSNGGNMKTGNRHLLEVAFGWIALGFIIGALWWLFTGCSKFPNEPPEERNQDWQVGCVEGCLPDSTEVRND